MGQFEAAHEGTLFLDEIGDLSLTAQAKILRILQERTVQHVGGREQIPVDVRILAATNKDLEAAVKDRRFREDLYYRLNVIHIRMPALREMREDIHELAHFFLGRYCEEFKKPAMTFAPEALAGLVAAPWAGQCSAVTERAETAGDLCGGRCGFGERSARGDAERGG